MADDGVGATSHQPSIGGREAERAAKGEEGHDTDRQAQDLQALPRIESPVRMSSNWPEQHRAERPAESKCPIAPPPAHRACRTADQVGKHNPRLLDEEYSAYRAVRPQVVLQGDLCKKRRAAGSDEIRRDPRELSCSGRRQFEL
jgi:hypothetical protein